MGSDETYTELQPLHKRNFVPINLHKMIEDVLLFHKTFGHPIQEKPTIPSPDRQVLRNKLIRDEYIGEFNPAWTACLAIGKKVADWPKDSALDPVKLHEEPTAQALAEFGDVIADLIYYLIGTALEYGIPLAQVWDAVQEANMSKLWTEKEFLERDDNNPEYRNWTARINDHVAATGSARCWKVVDEDGKVRKPPSWKEPNIVDIIKAAL